MLASYLDAAIETAHFEIIEEDGHFWGEIPLCQGVWAREASLVACQKALREALSDWVALRLRQILPIPIVAGIDLNQIGSSTHA